MEIGNGDDFESFRTQVLDHALEIRESFSVHGEGPVVLLVVDIEVEDVGGNLALPELRGNFPNLRLRIVAVAALLKSQREQRRQRSAAD